MKKAQEKCQSYITKEEQKKCRRVMRAFAKMYGKEDIAVLDMGKYGFVKLQYYYVPDGFYSVSTFTDSDELFIDLWREWRNYRLFSLTKNTPMADFEYKQKFQCLPRKMKEKIRKKKVYFARRAGKKIIGKRKR